MIFHIILFICILHLLQPQETDNTRNETDTFAGVIKVI